MKRYINLSAHSNCSFGESVVTPAEILEFAANDGAKAAALTDLNSVHGLHEFSKAAEKYKDKGIKPIYGVQIFGMDSDKASALRKITLLARNRNGLKSIYKVMSLGHTKLLTDTEWPCVSYKDIINNREGILVGLECTESDVKKVLANDARTAADELVNEEYAIADYVQIKLPRRYAEAAGDQACVKSALYRIAESMERANKLAVAADGSNCVTDRDELCCSILRDIFPEKHPGAIPFLTTEEMLNEYESEGSEMARKLVLDNTNTIADMIEDFSIEDKARCSFSLPNAEEKLKNSCEKALNEKYGENVPEFISARFESEIKNILSNGFASSYVIASMLANKSRELGYLYNIRGFGAGSFVGYIMGIAESNPLPPHYYCPHCKHVEAVDAKKYPSGFDLNGYGVEKKNCPVCGEIMVGDGHNIPVEFFAGFAGDKVPDFNFNFAPEIQGDMVEYLENILGKGRIFCAGTEAHLPYRAAKNLLADYRAGHDLRLTSDEEDIIKERLSSALISGGRYLERMLVVPDGKEIFDFSPVGYDKQSQLRQSLMPATLIGFYKLPLERLFIGGLDMFSKLKLMEKMTGISAKTINFDEIDTDAFFHGDSLRGLPLNADIIKEIVDKLPTARFSDLVRIYGLAHGVGAWNGNGEELVKEGVDPEELISHREDIMLTLLTNGADRKTAFRMAEAIGKGMAEECPDELKKCGMEERYIESAERIAYLFPKTHAVEYVTNYLRMIWYKIYYPAAFYAAVLSVDATDSDIFIIAKGKERIELELKSIYQARNRDDAGKHKDTLELALECRERGISFVPNDGDDSDSYRFTPDGNALRLP